ncbi:RND transporter [Leptolyngbya sp. 'hensonii']|uniref:efflux RND transporter permease subunit n=1 Tax=Leptolyngbya sp. 'hensonii' TaxID=1922337 RepID=UPI0009502031|nr:efflux RND transporter permease subunit [Leptolyngbya sp. 'hensonii']OLP18023.1 RND transporter [Leptolyngbya sp. 'hensonii']
MILSISDFFIRRPVLATVCSIIITLLGIAAIPLLPVAQFPDITPPQVTVTANYVGANAEVVESTVTNILERELNGVEGVKYISSTSANDGTSSINLTFELERNKDIAAVDVQNRVATVLSRLPGPVTQTGVRVEKENSGFLLAIGIYSDTGPDGKPLYDDIYLSNYTDLYIADAVKRIKGVGNVIIFGERKYAMRLWLDPTRLASRGLSPQDVVSALQDQNLQVGAGQVGQQPAPPDQQYQMTISAKGRLKTEAEFGDIVIPSAQNGTLVYLRDIGRVELGAENYGSILRFGRRDDKTGEMVISQGIGMGVSQLPGSNALDVADAVLAEMTRLAESFPPGLHYQDAFNTTAFIKAGVEEVVKTLFETVGLVILVIFLFLQNWRSTLIPSIAIPVSLIGTFMFVELLGFSINTLTLFGISLATGLVVDDAIIVVEDITRRIQDQGLSPFEAARQSMDALFSAVIATSLVLIAVFVPVAFFPGTTGQLYKQFALTIAFSITISTFNAITLTPTLAALLLRRGQTPNNWFFNGINRWIGWTRGGYERNLNRTVRWKWGVLALFTGGLVLTSWFYGFVPKAFIPEEDQGYFITIVQGPEGVSLNYTTDVLKKAEAIIQEEPEVKNIFAVGGFSFSGNTPNNGIIFTTLKPWDERKGSKSTAQAIIGTPFPPPGSGLFPKLLGIKDAIVIPFSPPAIQGLGNFGGFSFQLQDQRGLGFGAMGETLGKFLGRATTYPSPQSPQLAGLRPNFSVNTPQLSVEVDRVRANALQVSLSEVFSTLQIFLGSQYVNDFNQFERTYRVYVQADQQFRSSPEDIGKLYVRSRTGQMIPLSNLVTVKQTTAPSIINHFNLFRSIEIQGGPAPGVSSGQAIAAMQQIAKETLPRGFGYEWSGIALEEIQAGGQALLIFGLGVVFVFLVLAAQYESYIDPVIIMLTVPLAILGALFTVWLRGMMNFLLSLATGVPLPAFANDVYTQIGLVMLVGIASKNAILIVEFANQLREEGETIVRSAIKASEGRLRPILMTAFASVAGAIPLLVAGGAGAAARQSLGTAIVGGICVATVLSLFVIPVLYIIIKGLEARLGLKSHNPAPAGEASFSNDGKGSYSGNGASPETPHHDSSPAQREKL